MRSQWSARLFSLEGDLLRSLLLPAALWLAISWTVPNVVGNDISPLRVVSFCPQGMEPIPGSQARLGRVLEHIQLFFREGMEENGFGPMSFRLDREAEGGLRVALVRGEAPMDEYHRQRPEAFAKIQREVSSALREQGLRPEEETVLVFTPLLIWEGNRTREVGPYAGGGNHLSGFCIAFDDPRLDPRKLASKEPGGFFRRPCSLGTFNSAYIGGIAHELGHAFGLPHVQETKAEAKRGTALMGRGNLTYGQELRGEGNGTFLTKASALILAGNARFAGDLPGSRAPVRAELTGLEAAWRRGRLVFQGRIDAQPRAVGVIFRNDDRTKPDTYEAVGWTAPVDGTGRFRIEIGEFQPGSWALLGRVCHENGAASRFSLPYEVGPSGEPEPERFEAEVVFRRVFAALASGDEETVDRLLTGMEQTFENAEVRRKAAHLRRLLEEPEPLRDAASISAAETQVPVPDLVCAEEEVGWGRPMRDRAFVQREGQSPLLTVAGRFFERGFYAHAPSRYVLELAGQWGRFTAAYGIQDGHPGSVVFVIRTDGAERFRSDEVKTGELKRTELDIRGVDRLELIVENAGDGNGADWGVWANPVLHRAGKE